MTILLDLSGVSGVAFFNLLTISGDDGGLGLTDKPGDPTVFPITYLETPGQPATADRLNQLVNNNFGAPVTTTQNIVVTAMNGGNDPYSGQDVTGNGITYIDSSGSSTVIRVVYDVSQCCGKGLACFDTSGNPISTPNPVILYHELSHAFRAATGTQQTNDEPPAETDENVMRTELGLCLRDVNNHGGQCGSGNNCGGSDGGPDGGPPSGGCAAGNSNGCFIVSAATGSPASIEVSRLQQMRHRISTSSAVGKRLIDDIYGEYWQFSPKMAEEIKLDPILRGVALQIVVRPLLAWYALAGALALENASRDEVQLAELALLRVCPSDVGGPVVDWLEAIQAGELSLPTVPRHLRRVIERLQQASRFPLASWAMLDPLTRAWKAGQGRLDLVDEVAEWLANAPLEKVSPPSSPELFEMDVKVLAGYFEFRPDARQRLGRRLAAAWPDTATTLERHGLYDH